jgi:hypothetical protein
MRIAPSINAINKPTRIFKIYINRDCEGAGAEGGRGLGIAKWIWDGSMKTGGAVAILLFNNE